MTRLKLATGETFSSLRYRNLRLFFVGQVISQVGTWLGMVAQTLLVLKLTDSGLALGLLAAAQFGPMLLLGPWAGLVADRSDKRRLLINVRILTMVQTFVMAGLAFWGSPPILLIYGVALARGLIIAFENPARRSFVVEMVPDEQVNNAVSLNSALMTSARVVGPALAGLMIITVGFGWTFTLDGLSNLAVVAGLVMIRPSEMRPAELVPRAKGQVREGLRYAASQPELWVPLVMTAIVGTLAFNYQVILPLFVTNDLGGSDSTFTLLLSVLSIGSLVGALSVARRTTNTIHHIGTTAVIYGGVLVLMSLAPNALFAFLVGPVMGAASIAFMTAGTALVQTEAEPAMRGRVLALQAMVFLGTQPIGGPIVGWMSETYGARWALAMGALASVGAGAWGVRQARRVERSRVRPTLAVDAARPAPVPADRRATDHQDTGQIDAVSVGG